MREGKNEFLLWAKQTDNEASVQHEGLLLQIQAKGREEE